MKVYFSCSLTGGRNDEAVYGALVDRMLDAGHNVLTAHLARPEVMRAERVVDPGEVYHRDVAWIEECQALVAEVSTPSHGVGYEIAWALGLHKPVLCIYRREARVSKMITGNDSPTLRVLTYSTPHEAVAAVEGYLSEVAGRAR